MCVLCGFGLANPARHLSSSASQALAGGKPSYGWSQAADTIAEHGWADAAARPVTYGFRAWSYEAGFSRFDAAQIAAAEAALALWSDVANIKFQRVGSGTSGEAAYTNSAEILFSVDTSSDGYAWAYFPGMRGGTDISGDVFINTSWGWFGDMSRGGYDNMALMHEIGHAIGLNHPGAYNGGSPTYDADAAYREDSRQYTVMSYFDAEETGAFHGDTFASTPLLHDIAAAQLLYGANMSTRTGDTVYGFGSTAGRAAFQISNAAQKVVFAIWDAGGIDTLNLSGYAQAARIDLRQEAFTSAGGLSGNIAIARGAVIENAVGGTGSDTMVGNSADNRLVGGGGGDRLEGLAGNDVLDGGGGHDTLIGGEGMDRATYWGYASGLTIDLMTPDINTGSAAGNCYDSIEGLVGTAYGDFMHGDDAANDLSGAAGNDLLQGRGGDDVLRGGLGGDELIGGAGADLLQGGLGFDFASYRGATEAVSADLQAGAGWHGEAIGDGFTEIEGLKGAEQGDTLLGSAAANQIYGFGGNDVIRGRAGADKLWGGDGADRFVFGSAAEGRDTIGDFERGMDQLALQGAGFGGLAAGDLAADRLVLGSAADRAQGQLLFDATTSNLYWDADGSGAGARQLVAKLAGVTTLATTDFVIV